MARPKKSHFQTVAPVVIRKDVHTSQLEMEKPRDILLPESGEIIHDASIVAQEKQYFDDLAFNEEPVTIIIDQPIGDFSPQTQDCWCNGNPPELLINGKWYPKAAIPLNIEVTTKRKYVEILLRSKPYNVRTTHDQQTEANPNPENRVQRTPTRAVNMSIIGDSSSKAREWQQRAMREA